MPRSPQEANPDAPPGLRDPRMAWLLSPSHAALAAILAYALLCVPFLAMHRFDVGIFVNAGDRYVTAARMHPLIFVKTHSDGYDGQFFYRMTVSPFSLQTAADGIVFDHPAKRQQRFLYPLLAAIAAFFQPRFAAWSLFLLNLAGIGAIAAAAATIARRMVLQPSAVLAILSWPGLIVTLTHDTAEIATGACLLWSLAALLAKRFALYAVLATCTVFARETALPVFAGILLWQAWCFRNPAASRRAGALVATASACVAFAAWHVLLGLWAGHAPDAQPVEQDIGLPFFGFPRMLADCITGARAWASTPLKDEVIRAMVLASAPVILLFCARTVLELPAALQRPTIAPHAAAYIAMVALMSLLTAAGPWIDPIAYFRAFTECFLIGCLVLFAGKNPPGFRTVAVVGAAEVALAWVLCFLKLRGG